MFDQVIKVEFQGKIYTQEHGNPFDRGSADSWYSRPINPHYYKDGTYKSGAVEQADMTVEQIEAYLAGYAHNEEHGDKKVW